MSNLWNYEKLYSLTLGVHDVYTSAGVYIYHLYLDGKVSDYGRFIKQ